MEAAAARGYVVVELVPVITIVDKQIQNYTIVIYRNAYIKVYHFE